MKRKHVLIILVLLVSVATAFTVSSCPMEDRFTYRSFDVTSDGSKIAYTYRGSGGSGIALWDLSTGKKRTLVDESGAETMPSFSPSGELLAYVSMHGLDKSVLSIVNLKDGTRSLLPVPNGEFCYAPRFLDEDTLAFAASRLKRPYSMGGEVRDEFAFYLYFLKEKRATRITDYDYSESIDIARGEGDHFYVTCGERGFPGLAKIDRKGQVTAILPNSSSVTWCSKGLFFVQAIKSVVPYDFEIFQGTTNKTQVTNLRSVVYLIRATDSGDIFFLEDIDRQDRFTLKRMQNGSIVKLADPAIFEGPPKSD